MESYIEKGPEKIPTKDEVLEVISRFSENLSFERELSDDHGLYLLEVKTEGKNPGETNLYRYSRKGMFPNKNESSETSIQVVFYEGEIPVGGEVIAVYNSETGEWK